MTRRLSLILLGFAVTQHAGAQGQTPKISDWPLYGGTPARNMVNLVDKNVPVEWSVEEGKQKNIKWEAKLGNLSYSGPVVAGGRVFVGTNNANPRNLKKAGAMSVLMCFDEKTGKFLWQIAHEAGAGPIFAEVEKYGLLSTPVVDGKRLYYVLPQSIVVCADVESGRIVWEYDMRQELKVTPYHCSNCSPLVVGKLIFLVTGNGNNANGLDAKAPSFIALTTAGKLAWKSNLPGDRIFEGSWSNPAYAVIQGKPQVVFPGGDAALYSFEPDTGNLIWEFHCYPRKEGRPKIDDYIVATPVIHDNKVYVGLGLQPDNGVTSRFTYFLCVDATKTGDVSPSGLSPQAVQGKNSALLWSYGGPIAAPAKGERNIAFNKTLSTCAIHDGLVYIPEEAGYMHCLDARTGKKQWVYDFKTAVWGSPYYVDGKVYQCTEDGDVVIFKAGRQMIIYDQEKMKFVDGNSKDIKNIEMGDTPLHSTPVVANGVLYIATKSKLFAIAAK